MEKNVGVVVALRRGTAKEDPPAFSGGNTEKSGWLHKLGGVLQ